MNRNLKLIKEIKEDNIQRVLDLINIEKHKDLAADVNFHYK